ncbi:MAG TPA: type II secretion system pseudopilin PulG [Moraxellaceae bacterium]|nr:type II secretion system pseudopilin PulG [Moraxellaceae bacterium]
MARGLRTGKPQGGFAYIWILMALTLLGLGLGRALEVYHHELQREKEEQLLYIGNQYRLAIESYYNTSPGMLKRYPLKLENLILDTRMVSIKRHIRALQKDPITGSIAWGLIRNRQGEIIGIHSLSKKQPVRLAHLDGAHPYLNEAESLSDWVFLATPAHQ